jgi:hypothetical protein
MKYNQTNSQETVPTAAASSAKPKVRRLLSNKRDGWIVAAALSFALIGLAGCAATTPTPAATSSSSSPAAAGHGLPASGGGGSNARSGPAEGGSSGTVTSVSTSGFDLTTAAGQKVTVKTASTTTYEKGTASASVTAVTKGATVLVLGMTSSTTITASQVIVQPGGIGGTPAYSPSAVASFQKGSPSTAKQDGKIPANYTEGSGTIVTGTTADKAAEAALAAYPGGVVDRVVKLSGGEYEVHYIGVNWPHHIFVSTSFTVVGAN